MRATGIDRIDRLRRGSRVALVEQIGTKLAARYAGCSLNRNDTLRRHPVPVGNRGLGNANLPGKFGDAAGLVDRARDVAVSWRADGSGAVVNASRSVVHPPGAETDWRSAVARAAAAAREDLDVAHVVA